MSIGNVTISEAVVWFIAACAGFATIVGAIKTAREIFGKQNLKKQVKDLSDKCDAYEKRIKTLEDKEEKNKTLNLDGRISTLEKQVQGLTESMSVTMKGVCALIDRGLGIGTDEDLREARKAFTDFWSNGGKK